MTTIPQLCDPVHFVAADDPFADVEDPLTAKSCRAALVTETSDDPNVLSLYVFDPAAGSRMVELSRFDEVTLPKIEPGPSGRDIGTWHHAGMCG